MITAVHTLVYAHDPERARAFFRDVLEWPYVDAHGGWLIFATGPSELGVHPVTGMGTPDGQPVLEHHEITFMCDDIEATRAGLEAKGAEFSSGIQDASFGRTMTLVVPGAGDIMVYQPRHQVAHGLGRS